MCTCRDETDDRSSQHKAGCKTGDGNLCHYYLFAYWWNAHIVAFVGHEVRQANHDIPPLIWWNNLERILLAVDDLGCRDLLS